MNQDTYGLEAGHEVRPAPPSPPLAPVTGTTADGTVASDARCVVCSYELRGLNVAGRCPECGTGVARSLQGNLLLYSSGEYLANLHRGVFIVLASIIAQILTMMLGIAAMILAQSTGNAGAAEPLQLGMQMILLAIGIASLWGYWLFSAPDPAILGVNNGATARQVVRVTLVVNAAATVVNAAATFTINVNSPGAAAAVAGIGLVSTLAWVVQFFASMRYLRWLAPRLPDPRVFQRAGLMMWLGPVLMTIGMLACGIGPLVALILYWNMLDWVRKDLKLLRERQLVELVP